MAKIFKFIFDKLSRPEKCLGYGRSDTLFQDANGKWICKHCDFVHEHD